MIEKNIRLQPHHSRDLLVGRRSDGRRPGYQPPGGGATSLGSGRDYSPSRSSGNGGASHDRGGQQHAAQAATAQAAAAANRAAEQIISPHINTLYMKEQQKIADSLNKQMRESEAQEAAWRAEEDVPLDKRHIKDTQKEIREGIKELGKDYDPSLTKEQKKQVNAELAAYYGDKPGTKYDLSDFGADKAWGQKKSGIMSKALGFLGDTALTVFSGGSNKALAYTAKAIKAKRRYDKIAETAWGKKFGLKKFNLRDINKDIRKQISKDDIPKVAEKVWGPQKYLQPKKKTVRKDDNGRADATQILPETLQSTVSEGTQMFLTDKQREQYRLAQNKMKAALAEGFYIDKDGKHVDLSEEQINALTQWITRINDLLVDPMPVGAAEGGRIDKALTGRSRDI